MTFADLPGDRSQAVTQWRQALILALMSDTTWPDPTLIGVAAACELASCHHCRWYPLAPQPAENSTLYWPGVNPISR